MTTSRGKPLSEWTDSELNDTLRHNAPSVVYSMRDVADERERRSSAKLTRLNLIATIAAAVAAIFSALAALASALR